MLVTDWGSRSQTKSFDPEEVKDFASKYLQHDLDIYRGSALDRIKREVEKSWRKIPDELKSEFGSGTSTHPPTAILDTLHMVPGELVMDPLQLLRRDEKRWRYDPGRQLFYQGISLDAVMDLLSYNTVNFALGYYTQLLEVQARLVIKSWHQLDPKTQSLIRKYSERTDDRYIRTLERPIPFAFVKLWHKHFVAVSEGKGTDGPKGGTTPPAGGIDFEHVGDGSPSPVLGKSARHLSPAARNAAMVGAKFFAGRQLTVPPPQLRSAVVFSQIRR
jgi:hypothetical protein